MTHATSLRSQVGPTRARHTARSRRQVALAPLRHAGRHRPRHDPVDRPRARRRRRRDGRLHARARRPTSTRPARVALVVHGRGWAGLAARVRAPSTPATRAPRCACWPGSWPAGRSAPRSPATTRSGAGRCGGSSTRCPRWARRIDSDHGRRAARHRRRARSGRWPGPRRCQRPSQERHHARRPRRRRARHAVTEPLATRDHTERAFPAFGLKSTVDGLTVRVSGGQEATAPLADAASARATRPRPRSGRQRPRRCPGHRSESRASASTRAGSASPARLSGWAPRISVDVTGEVAGEPVGTLEVAHDGHAPRTVIRARGRPRPHRRTARAGRAGGARRLARGLRGRRAAGQGKRPDRRARRRVSPRSACGPKSGLTASWSTGRGRRWAAPSTPPETIGWSWRSRSSALGASGPDADHRRRGGCGLLSRTSPGIWPRLTAR